MVNHEVFILYHARERMIHYLFLVHTYAIDIYNLQDQSSPKN